MSQRDLLLTVLKRGAMMVPRHIDDFSDAEMLARPVPAANHAAWQLSHVAFFMAKTLAAMGLAVAPLPNAMTTGKEFHDSDESSKFPSKSDLVTFFAAAYAAIIAAVEKMNEEELSAPVPGSTSATPPSTAFSVLMIPYHATMHLGQIQVIRRALKKPVLF